jgi:hypothetical protein
MIHEYNMKIEAKTENEATEKMKALMVLASKLTAKELSGLAHTVKNDPVKTALAKKYMGL